MQMPIMTIVDVRLGAVTLAPPGEPPLVLTHDGFIYKGERIEDGGKAYELFYDTMTRINAREQQLYRTMAKDAQRHSWVAHHVHHEFRPENEGGECFTVSPRNEVFDETCDDFDDFVDGQMILAGWRAPG